MMSSSSSSHHHAHLHPDDLLWLSSLASPPLLNCGDFMSNTSLMAPSSTPPLPPPLMSSLIVQDLGLQWPAAIGDSFMNIQSHHQPLLWSRIKEELPNSIEQNHLDEKLLLRALASQCHQNMSSGLLPPPASDLFFENPSCLADLGGGGGNLSMVLPPCPVSLLPLPLPLPLPSCMEMELQSIDLLASARLCTNSGQAPGNGVSLLREDIPFWRPTHLQGAVQGPASQLHKMPCLLSGVGEERGRSTVVEQKSSRKPRFVSRSSLSSFKVRKEKLGDRIAALQQLVAPFGKTDTASVLMEAIGYIKFLQDQVETLSAPYLRSPRNKKLRTMQEEAGYENKEEAKLDLRSRGLCLVPLSCTSYVTNENGGIWLPPDYRGTG